MVALTLIYCGFVICMGLWVYFSSRDRKAIALLLALTFGAAYLSVAGVMGYPNFITSPNKEVQVVGVYLDEGTAIYVWVLEGEPRAYRLPWSMETAKQLRGAAERAGKQGGNLMMRKGIPEGEWMFYPDPVKELPPKTAERR